VIFVGPHQAIAFGSINLANLKTRLQKWRRLTQQFQGRFRFNRLHIFPDSSDSLVQRDQGSRDYSATNFFPSSTTREHRSKKRHRIEMIGNFFFSPCESTRSVAQGSEYRSRRQFATTSTFVHRATLQKPMHVRQMTEKYFLRKIGSL